MHVSRRSGRGRTTNHPWRRAAGAIAVVALVLVGSPGTSVGAPGDPAVLQGQASRLYSAYFLRAPDLAGLRFWVGRLQTGTPLSAASQVFSESSEFRNRYGSLTDAQFVDLVYQNVLGRAPDVSGRSYWASGLAARRFTRGSVMVGFSESNEFVRKTGTTPPRPPSYGDGMHRGVTGTWRNVSNAGGCYWERLSGFSGSLHDVIANDFTTEGRSIVTLESGDAGFSSNRCGTWVPDVGPITLSPTQPFGPGTFRVGRDVAPGTWRAVNTDGCYWERLNGFSGEFEDIVENDIGDGTRLVTIAPGDVGFTSNRCGTWTKVG